MANRSHRSGSLEREDVDAIARAVAAELRPLLDRPAVAEWLTPHQYAQRFDVAPSTVYLHADSLGAVRIGSALRLPATPPRAVASQPPVSSPPPARRRPRASHTDLLPVGRRA